VKRGQGAALPIALAVTVVVALLDLMTPPEVNFGQLYLVPVVMTAWVFGWRTGTVFAGVVALAEVVMDSSLLRSADEATAPVTVIWNAFSSFLAFTILAVVTDRVYQERERWQSVNGERARLLRLLEREFPRPLRAIEWFTRTFEEGLERERPLPDKLREQFNGLRHHTREVNFLATDLIRIGRLRGGELGFTPEAVDLKRIATEAANETVDRNRVVVTSSEEQLMVLADPEPMRHAISAAIGRLLERGPYELVHVFVRGSEREAVVELTCRGAAVTAEDFELANLLTTANGGRLVVVLRSGERGIRVNIYVPRAERSASVPSDTPVSTHA
jgi:signal transduction histidine kinase